jgi:hypothetical protein
MDVTLIVLRVIHIVFGVFWAGMAFFLASLLLPAVRANGPAGVAIMRHLAVPKRLPAAITTSALLTVLAGFGLYWHNTSLSGGGWPSSRPGMIYGVGAIFAIVAVTIGIAVVGRGVEKLVQLGKAIEATGVAPTAEQAGRLAGLQRRVTLGTRIVAGLLGITVIAMAIARYI